MTDTCAVVQTVFSVLGFIAAILIPEKIKWEQTYSSLLSDYRGYDFAAAVQGIIDFFYDSCDKKIEIIETEYKEVCKKAFKKGSGNKKNVSNDQNLHYQRRLLNEFYWQLYECVKSPWIGRRRVLKDFTNKEADILRIVFYMNKAIEEDKEGIIFKDISVSDRVQNPIRLKGMNRTISLMYHLLKNADSFIKE